ncbi:unnamed protein product [Eruca vesicaria subsp. sativa]|uniref:Uncharacterized protein n=1 Tax=Eruca vesicaria subsp. sativa TaxID=29727 RepID=A0ABC8M0P2_ERUVS|nr:unnamed protein product [Eruca vesicaria subsp. sativa]
MVQISREIDVSKEALIQITSRLRANAFDMEGAISALMRSCLVFLQHQMLVIDWTMIEEIPEDLNAGIIILVVMAQVGLLKVIHLMVRGLVLVVILNMESMEVMHLDAVAVLGYPTIPLPINIIRLLVDD